LSVVSNFLNTVCLRASIILFEYPIQDHIYSNYLLSLTGLETKSDLISIIQVYLYTRYYKKKTDLNTRNDK